MRMTLLAAARGIAALLLVAPVIARAAPPSAEPQTTFTENMERAAELMAQGLGIALDSLGTLLRSMPRYELPQMDANGDIIIRRKPPNEPSAGKDGRAI